MVRFTGGLLLFAAFAAAAPSEPYSNAGELQQVITKPPSSSKTQSAPRKLQGKFLHITDIHPDPFYKVHSDPDESCHAGKGHAGHYGAEVTSCDTPFSLVNATFKWIEEHLKDEVDFVVWTGDSARHDNDERFPRTDKQVIKLNRFMVDKFVEVFGKSDNIDDPDPTNDFIVPIVPTFGNNDIIPHNIFQPGPNKWTKAYSDIWAQFVPQAQRHSFARGGWFFTEVIPNKLAVFSLNTLYFFDSNSAVDGCDLKSEPGYEHMEWLRIQLQFLRDRGMKAIIIGHVPPARTESKQSWDESCYQKYTLWLHQYRDVIVTSIYGHMNLDHFIFQDIKELKDKYKIKRVDDDHALSDQFKLFSRDEMLTITAKAKYLNELREGWSDLPKPPSGYSYSVTEPEELFGEDINIQKKKKKKKQPDEREELEKFLAAIGGPWGERFSLSLVSPSVVPNFFPTLRVVQYNITGMELDHPATGAIGTPAEEDASTIIDHDDLEDTSIDDCLSIDEEESEDVHDLKKKKKHKKKKKKEKENPKKPTFPVPKPPSKASLPGPGYSPQPLSLISWTQYYANLTEIHDEIYKDKIAKDPDKYFKYDVEYTTDNDQNYQMRDLTMRSWLDLAERIGRDQLSSMDVGRELGDESDPEPMKKGGKKKTKTSKNHLWKVFVKRAFVNTKLDEEIDQDFG
ncbi:uncharacterized protein Z518_05836 [Rhinocladiella mackenziei CBS 650.93]|uniref:Endopolyphosphatase n=1 Tax=Rhinocladiella mackenziei CBS 650.93 TaxID=1442369 RepID=A0A0D2IGU1_9EURO|nr:uncharacterized protein Z518_05836 [Rhinocladiella mackenziei CBS 650.93]KIX04964.1 hypothetical protein Z518_05836 [Rhinocladiella mackenziei CBS 650.93]